jgi:pimeloyl-ACP methyl ester carboxylesterase
LGVFVPKEIHEEDAPVLDLVEAVVVTIHGQESKGKNLQVLSAKLASEMSYNTDFVNVRYTRLLTIVNTLPWVRTMTAKYIASRLETIGLKWPIAKVIVIAHSNGTVALARALKNRDNPNKKWPHFQVDGLILLGCPMKRNFDWSKFPDTEVINFISKNDLVVFMARAYGMGAAGRYGFKKKAKNLHQVCVRWGHSGFLKGYSFIRNSVKVIINPNSPYGK